MNPWVELSVIGSGIGFEKQVSPRRGPNCAMGKEGVLIADEPDATGWMGWLGLLVETSACGRGARGGQ
jgi:hypothetical protein